MSTDVTITISVGRGAEQGVTVAQAGAEQGESPLSLEVLGAAQASGAVGDEAPPPVALDQLGVGDEGAAAAPAPLEIDALGDSDSGQPEGGGGGSPPAPDGLKDPADHD